MLPPPSQYPPRIPIQIPRRLLPPLSVVNVPAYRPVRRICRRRNRNTRLGFKYQSLAAPCHLCRWSHISPCPPRMPSTRLLAVFAVSCINLDVAVAIAIPASDSYTDPLSSSFHRFRWYQRFALSAAYAAAIAIPASDSDTNPSSPSCHRCRWYQCFALSAAYAQYSPHRRLRRLLHKPKCRRRHRHIRLGFKSEFLAASCHRCRW
jgi:hypothetical protein